MTARPSFTALDALVRDLAAPETAALDDARYAQRWLDCVIAGIPGVTQAVLVLAERPDTGPFLPAAMWPAQTPCGPELAGVCEQVLELRGPVNRQGPQGTVMGWPIVHEGALIGVIGLTGRELGTMARAWLQWGLAWLLLRRDQSAAAGADALRERLLLTLDLVTSVLEEPGFDAAAQRLATDAAVRMGCDRVVIGLQHSGLVRVVALSHSADFTRRGDLVNALEAALNETAEQGVSLGVQHGALDAGEHGSILSARDHLRLVQDFGAGSLLSVPFALDDERSGVFLFEWTSPAWPEPARLQAETLAPILGRVLLDRRHAERNLWQRTRDGVRAELRKLLGPLHTTRKLVALASGLCVLLAIVAHGDHRIAAPATVEGAVRRALVAPFDGFVASAEVRAGQTVKAGQVLATLDDRDLRLEAQRWSSQQEQHQRQARDAEAQFQLAQIQIAMAQAGQARAQRELAESQLNRARISAPFDGMVVAGDLSQQLGGAVRKGQTLFEMAPLDAYRLVLEVPEADMARIAVGQKGQLVVTALTDTALPFTVTLITPVATAKDGLNHFRVEATLDAHPAQLRPGMQGVAKIHVGEARLVWIWTYRMWDWLRLQSWKWLGW